MNAVTEETEAHRRRDMLASEMEKFIAADHASARSAEVLVDRLYWVGIAGSAMATLLRVVHSQYIEGWMISFLAGIAKVTAVIPRDAKLRDKSNWFYERRDVLDGLRQTLLYQGPVPITAEYIAAISRDMIKARAELGLKMSKIHKSAEGS